MTAEGAREWTVEQYGDFLLSLPLTSMLIDQVDAAPDDVQRYFWTRTEALRLSELTKDADRVVARLLQFERSHLAVRAISWLLYRAPDAVAPAMIADVLEQAISTAPISSASSSPL